MNPQYLGLVFLVIVAAVIAGAMVTLSWVLGPKRFTPYKTAPYECGVAPLGDARERFPIKFYVVAILFILFDIEVVFLWPWIVTFKAAPPEQKLFTFVIMIGYMATWVLGYVYAIRVGALDWSGTNEKLLEKAMAETKGEEAA